ncbi:uncharacterized protein [Mycetomoellerius zeteki]|uniref:uncharacterized protein n=1 Tax=Mycetomoellerius zeteki TaxID=64791 RepID=UPI00084E76E5|nr:PREDICTED: uncharacterized protein LOC108730583 [Trachymyrmex zeteki]
MVQFQISAPDTLSLFGEHAKKGLIASINLRTTLTFNELPISLDNIIINIPQIYLFYNVSLQEFLKLYDSCIENMELLQEKVLQYTSNLYIPTNHRVIMQIFYYLLVYITYKEQIKIKSFNISSFTKFMDKEFACPAFIVCFAACLLHWSHVQKEYQFEEIHVIPIVSVSNVTILLVDSKQTQNLKTQEQQRTELMNMFPDIANSILNNIDTVTNMACNTLQKFDKICENDELSTETRNNFLIQQHKELDTYICKNRKLLQLLDISHYNLDKIYEIAQRHGFSAKYTNIGNNKLYAYIWCPLLYTNASKLVELLWDELKKYDFDIMKIYLDVAE